MMSGLGFSGGLYYRFNSVGHCSNMAYNSECTPYLQSSRRIARHEQTIYPKDRYGVKYAPDLVSPAYLPYFHCQRQFGVQGATVNFRRDPGCTPKRAWPRRWASGPAYLTCWCGYRAAGRSVSNSRPGSDRWPGLPWHPDQS
jgi:hypothetical protein